MCDNAAVSDKFVYYSAGIFSDSIANLTNHISWNDLNESMLPTKFLWGFSSNCFFYSPHDYSQQPCCVKYISPTRLV